MSDQDPTPVTGAGATGDTPRDQVQDPVTTTDTAGGGGDSGDGGDGPRVEGGGLSGDREGQNPGTVGHPGAPGYGTPPAE